MEVTTNIRRQESGKPISATNLSAMADRLNRTERDQRSTDLGGGPIIANGTRVMLFRFKSAADDHWVCRELVFDSSGAAQEGTTDIKIAKPDELRKTGWHGLTVNGLSYSYTSATARTVTKGTTTEDQIIIPTLDVAAGSFIGTKIWAAKGIAGGTGVYINKGQSGEERLEWLDLNVGGRAWAKKKT